MTPLNTLVLSGFHSSLALEPYPGAGQPVPRGDFIVVQLDDGPWLLAQRFLRLASRRSGEIVYSAGLRTAALFGQDQKSFAGNGLVDPFLANFKADLELMYKLYLGQKKAASVGSVERQLFLGDDDAAVVLVRRILNFADTRGLRGLFGRQASRFQSYNDRFHAVRIVSEKAQVPAVRAQLARIGTTDEMLGQLDALYGSLHQSRARRDQNRVDALQDSPQVQGGKALLLANITMISTLAQTEVPRERAREYVLRALLKGSGHPRRGKKAAPRATPATQPAPAPPPGAPPPAAHPAGHKVHPAGPGTHPRGPAPAGPAPLHGAKGVPPGAMPPVGPQAPELVPATSGAPAISQPAVGTAPPQTMPATAPATPATSLGAPAHPGLSPLVPGTVLATLPAAGGPPLKAVVRDDGGVQWQPDLKPAPAPPPPAEPAGGGPAPPPHRKRHPSGRKR